MIRSSHILQSLLISSLVVCLNSSLSLGEFLQPLPASEVSLSLLRVSDSVTPAEAAMDQQSPRIVGEATAAAYPWMVALVSARDGEDSSSPFCGGTLIDPRWVLTAAHCLDPRLSPSDIKVIIGRDGLSGDGGEDIAVERVVVNEDFRFFDLRSPDIALLQLQSASAAPTIPLVQSSDDARAGPGTTALILGWGALSAGTPVLSSELQEASVPLISNEECVSSGVLVDSSDICAGLIEGETDVCHGDDCGPLVVSDGEGGWLQVGISNSRSCARDSTPAVYTRVSSFDYWIQQQIHNTLYFAHFGNGEGFASELVVFNPSPTTATGSVSFRDSGGNPLDSDSVVSAIPGVRGRQNGAASFTLEPLSSTTISTPGIGSLVTGSATISADAAVAGLMRFHLPGVGMAGLGPSQAYRRVMVPVRRLTTLSTAVAIQNLSRVEVRVSLTLRDSRKSNFGNTEASLTIPPQGQVAKFIQELLDYVEGGFHGTLLIEAEEGAKVAVTALEIGSEPGQFTSLPLSAVPSPQ